MTCGILEPKVFGFKYITMFVFDENKSYLLVILKFQDPLINHMTTTLREPISNIKIDWTLKYINLIH
jgi:hypothetical protein